MTKIFRATIIFGATLIFVLSAADKAREQTLQRAIDLMESKGDLAKAMPLFEDAARSSDRAVAARALLYLGQAQERQGTEKARATYQRIVKEFSNQTETVAAAQKRLASLGEQGASSVLSKRLLCSDCGYFDETDFSADGRLMVFTHWDSGDLATRDMSTGKVERLMAKSGNWKDSKAYGESPVLSRDLRQIVYFWETDKESRTQLRIMPNEVGGKARVVVDNPEYRFLGPTAWSADGKSVLAVLRKRDNTWQIAWVSVADGAIKVLKSLDSRIQGGSHTTLSPDGRYIVYNARVLNPGNPRSATDSQDQHIYVLAADGSLETEVVKTAGINQYPVWTPDGKHILFVSDRSGKFDLWSIAVRNGKADGPESLVSSQIGKVVGAWMHGNSYYYTNNDIRAEYVNIADFAEGGSKQSRIVKATESFIGIRPAWSPDGKSIAFKRHHPGSADGYDTVVHSLETADERTYLTNLGTSMSGAPSWLDGGKTIEVGINGLICRFDLKTGESSAFPKSVLPAWLVQTTPFVHSPDENVIYAARNDPKDWDNLPMRIMAVNLTSGQERLVFTMPNPGNAWFALTPDVRTFVVMRKDQKSRTTHFSRLNADGTGYREIYNLPTKAFRDNFAITKDGRYLLVAKRNEEGKNWSLLRIPIEGGAPEPIGVELEENLYDRSIALSPNGTRIAYSSTKFNGEIWALDNVLSVLK